MSVQGISARTAAYNAPAKKKMNPVAKGALIGGGIEATCAAIGAISIKGAAQKAGMTFAEGLKTMGLSKGKYAAMRAAGLLLAIGIGAGIGKLVKNHNEKKAEK